jgi:Cu/Zn superoxide dismutase
MNKIDYNVFLLGTVFSFILSYVVNSKKKAICILDDTHSNGVTGTITLTAMEDQTIAQCNIMGLTPGLHGMHVHNKADFSKGCASTCSHYNPEDTTHGGPLGPNRHKGDFGNIYADEFGHCITTIVADVKLSEIVGRAFIIHADPDDLGQGGNEESLKTGNAGARIACGKITWDP